MGIRANTGLCVIVASLLLGGCDATSKDATTAAAATSASSSSAPAAPTAAAPTNTSTTTAATTPTTAPGNVSGSASVSWLPPQQNADGSALTDMAGFRIYYGSGADSLTEVVNIASVGVTRYVIDNLAAGTWFFAVRAFNTAGVEGELSNVASKTIG